MHCCRGLFLPDLLLGRFPVLCLRDLRLEHFSLVILQSPNIK